MKQTKKKPARTTKTAKTKKVQKKFNPPSNRKKILFGILLFGIIGVLYLASTFAAPPDGKGGGKGGGGGGGSSDDGGGGKGGSKGPKGGGGSTSPSTISTQSDLLALHNSICPQVMNYSTCDTMRVDMGTYDTGWTGYAHPAEGYVEYNLKSLGASTTAWTQMIAHEVGGHMDTWNELVAKVGTTQAWTDYYDINKYAEPFFEAKLSRDLTTSAAKEIFTDCQGAVRNGHQGVYLLYTYGVSSLSAQQDVCSGYRTIFDKAITS